MLTFLEFPCSQEKYSEILCRSGLVISGDFPLRFDPMVEWTIHAISSDCAAWMSADHTTVTSASRVAILSSFAFERLLSNFVDSTPSKAFRLLVETSSHMNMCQVSGIDASYARLDSDDVCSVRSFAGSIVLQFLESALSSKFLASASVDVLNALFLILFGTIIVVGYWRPISLANEMNVPKFSAHYDSERSSAAAQDQLLRILAHHMIRIGESLGLFDKVAKLDVIEKAYCQWNGNAMAVCQPSSDIKTEKHYNLMESIAQEIGADVTLNTGEPEDEMDPNREVPFTVLERGRDVDVNEDLQDLGFNESNPLANSWSQLWSNSWTPTDNPASYDWYSTIGDPSMMPEPEKCVFCGALLDVEGGCEACDYHLLKF